MANYRRADQPGGTFFFTLVTHRRRAVFADPANVQRLREAMLTVMNQQPFEFLAGVVLPDHAHYLWTLPPGDGDFSKRLGRMKALFTKSLVGWASPTIVLDAVGIAHPTHRMAPPAVGWASPTTKSASRLKHRDADVWQRRFWEHTIRDQDDLNRHLDYIHYNPVKHGLASCPHAWAASSFYRWVDRGGYQREWCCQCNGTAVSPPRFTWAREGME